MDMNEFRQAGHSIIDWIADYLETIEERPLFPKVEPRELYRLFEESMPEQPATAEAVIAEIQKKLIPYCAHVNHPGYFGLITPTPTPVGILGDLIAAALNQNVGAYTIGPSAVAMERRTVRWLNDLIGYDNKAGGNLTSGGMMANFIGLKLARDAATGNIAQHEGLHEACAVYVSEERHVSVDKAVDCVGIGRNQLRVIPTDQDFRIRIDLLEEAIADDQRNNVRPLCIVGLAGTTNTGSVDDLHQLSAIATRIGAWFHIDAAYGGGVFLSKKRSGLLDNVKLGDSVTMDPHKWFYAPLDAGAILVKEERQLTNSFGLKPAYLTDEMDKQQERYQYYVHGFEQSRRFRSLKVWMSFKRYGKTQIGEWIDANIEHAEHLYQLCRNTPDFVPAVKPLMSAICIRYQPQGSNEERLTKIHQEVARRIEEGGKFWISTTVLKELHWFRINPVNFRTRTHHLDDLMRTLETECKDVDAKIP
jgi:aromatic-L-amino-acid/L-tryptophan decarboxylase